MEQTTAQEQQVGRFLSKLKQMNKEDAFRRLDKFRVKLTYGEPVYLGRGFSRKAKTEFIVRFFRSTNGILCFAPNRKRVRTGYPVFGTFDSMKLNKLIGMEEFKSKEPELSQEEFDKREVKKVLKRLHPNVWPEFREELENYLKGEGDRPYFLRNNGKAVFRNIKSVFKYRSDDLEGIKRAMEEKGDYSCCVRGSGRGNSRDRSVQVRTEKDGTTRAWFSSEYYGCGNGSYYLLINPTTALYIEDD